MIISVLLDTLPVYSMCIIFAKVHTQPLDFCTLEFATLVLYFCTFEFAAPTTFVLLYP